MQRLLLLVNPMAGRQKIHSDLIYVIDELTKAGYETTVFTTQVNGGTAAILHQNDSRYDKVLCCGGDGTFNEVLTETMKWDKPPALGYIPAGTTNDFAQGMKLSSDIRTAIRDFIGGREYVYDAGRFNDCVFSYIASFGAFTETSYQTPQNIKNQLGHLAYILEGIMELPNLNSTRALVTADGSVYEGEYIFGAVCNTRSMGGIIRMNEDIVDLNDGLLEVMLIKMPRTLLDISTIVTSLNSMKYDSSSFVFFKTASLDIHTEIDLVWSLDGERVSGGKDAHIDCIHDAFRIIKR